MAEQQSEAKVESHDPDHPEAFLQFMRSGWRDDALSVTPLPEVPNYAKRRAALSEAFPGETLVIPTGGEKVRANDTDYPFQPGRALADCAPARTRVLRGLDANVDRTVLAYEPDAAVRRDRELARVISELKLTKDEWEIAQLQEAIDATVRGFEDVARVLPADRSVRERLLEGVFGLRARHDGNDVGYNSIVGAGAHATILHWVRNTGVTKPGELLLMDMGVEGHNLYTADVTRTVPVSGTFTALQRQVYDIVHASQQAGMDAIRPGVKFRDVHLTCMRVLAEGLHDLDLLPVSVDEAMSEESTVYRRWTLHGFGDMLGIDVHDCNYARQEG